MKIVINVCFGGFGLSHEAMLRYAEIKGVTLYPEQDKWGNYTYWTVPADQRPKDVEGMWHAMSLAERKAHNEAYSKAHIYDRDFARNDLTLVRVVEEMGDRAAGRHAKLKVVEVPDDAQWEIDEYDGNEHVAEKHRTWS